MKILQWGFLIMKEREGKDYNSKADVSLLKLFET